MAIDGKQIEASRRGAKKAKPEAKAGEDAAVASPEKSRTWLVFGLVLAISLSFAAYTNHAWEDYYITYRSSRTWPPDMAWCLRPASACTPSPRR